MFQPCEVVLLPFPFSDLTAWNTESTERQALDCADEPFKPIDVLTSRYRANGKSSIWQEWRA